MNLINGIGSRMDQAIGLFDSGVGGLTVLRQLIQRLPNEHFIYLGDTARVPYGNRSPETIVRYSIEGAKWLLKKNIKLLVIACNTISALALPALRQLFDIPIIGVIEAGAEKAVAVTQSQRIALLATRATIGSGTYQTAIHRLAPWATISPIACPLFVPLVEEQWLDHPATRLVIKEYLRPLRARQVDTVLLGCTHYPLLQQLIQEEVGNATLVDSASTCADHVQELLQSHQLAALNGTGKRHYYVTDDPEKFCQLGEYFLGHPLDFIERITLETELLLI